MATAYSKERTTDEMLDETLEGEDLSGLFHSGERTEELLDAFEESDLVRRYPDVVRSWHDRWELVIPFLAFSMSMTSNNVTLLAT